MRFITAHRHLLHVFAGLVALLFVLAAPFPLSAQEVVGVSAILGSTNSSHIDTFSATEMDPTIAFYYDAYVEGYLYQNNALLVPPGQAFGNPTASGGFTEPLIVGDTYQIDSLHYLVAFFAYTDGINTYYSNPYGFAGDGAGGDPSGTGFLPGGGATYETAEFILLGGTYVVLPTGVPSISSITPASGSVGSSGRITLQGANLEDPFTQTTTSAIDGSGVTLTLRSVAPTQVSLDFSIAQNASTGAHHITLSTRFGTSNAVVFNVGDPTPVVTGVSPNIWRAGTNFSVTLTGKGFGTSPTVSVSGTGVSVGAVSNPSDTQLSVGISVSSNAPNETVTIQVQSNGYNGSGFVATTPGEPQSGSNTATVEAAPAPAPMIMFNGQNITGTAQNVVVGQQIALTVAGLPSGVTITSQTWAPDAIGNGPVSLGTVVGGYNASAASGQVVAAPPLASNSPTSSGTGYGITFYWVQAGTGQYKLTFSYCLASGNCSDPEQCTATFNVTGPTSANIAAVTGAVKVLSPGGVPKMYFAGVPVTGGQVGIQFTASATLPSGNPGTYSWVQLLKTDQINILSSVGPQTCTPFSGAPELDNSYPYSVTPSPTTATDNPGVTLASNQGEVTRSFSATMYLMWNSGLPNSIPAPLGTVSWQFQGDSINTLQTQTNTTTWIIGCGTGSANAFQLSNPATDPNQSYPMWSATDMNGTYSCH